MSQHKNKTNKLFKIGIPVFLVILICFLSVNFIFVSLNKYNNAMELIDNKQYDEAKEILDGINIKDSKEQLELLKAREFFDDLNYEEGIQCVLNAGGQVEVNYDTDGGKTSITNEIIKKSKYINNDSNKDGYELSKWYLDSYELDHKEYYATLNLKAEYKLIEYNITLNLDGGSFESDVPSTYTFLDDDIIIPSPSKDGYEFIGWTGTGLSEPTKTVTIEKGSVGNKEYTANWESDGLLYVLNEDGKSYTVYKGNRDKSEIIISAYYKGLPVTGIGKSAFYFYNSLVSIKLPDTLISIGDEAFAGCKNLTSINIRDGVTSIGKSAFYKCSSLISVELPSRLTSIEESTFSFCESLTSIVIKEGVTSIGESAFSNCKSLTSVKLPTTLTNIGDSIFEHCTSLTSIAIPENIKKISEAAFIDCTSLTTVELPSTLTIIEQASFSSCEKLKNILIPDGVTSIGRNAFSACTSLTNIELPSTLTNIGYSAFFYCRSLTSIEVNTNNQHFKSIDGNLYSKDGEKLIQYAIGKKEKSFIVPEGVTIIGERAFSNCIVIKNVELPSTLKIIGNEAFYSCIELANISLPDSLTTIGEFAFTGCQNKIIRIVIPNSVTTIGKKAFAMCNNLSIFCEASGLQEGWDDEWNYSNRPVYWAGEWEYIDGLPEPKE